MRIAAAIAIACLAPVVCAAQDLTPRAYVVVPVESNAVNVTYAFADGELLFDPTVPIEDAVGTIHTPVFSYFYNFGFFGRSANISGSIPFAIGDFSGVVLGRDRSAHRQGLADLPVRFSVNLIGGPALTAAAFVKTPPPRRTLGASVKVIAPTGQYHPEFAINIGTNRWSFKPELGFTRHAGPLTLDAYAGVWFFTSNDDAVAVTDLDGLVARQRDRSRDAESRVGLQRVVVPHAVNGRLAAAPVVDVRRDP